MQIPETPPSMEALIAQVGRDGPERLLAAFVSAQPEVDGRYLHWDELRRRSPPAERSLAEWWLSVAIARLGRQQLLPLNDKSAQPFRCVQTELVQRLLHRIDREVGRKLELSDPMLANRDIRDRYVLRSLMEEAIASSQLEGASTTRRVAKEMLTSGRAPHTVDERMIANNFRAMEMLRERSEAPLSVDFVLELHRTLTEGTLPPDEVGRFRRADEPVTVQDHADGTVLHVPPDAAELPTRLEAICAFANDTGEQVFVHPIIRAIVLHFALAYDHPFVDGNGRTARALFYWSMLHQGYWLASFLSISRLIQQAPARYSRAFLHSETDRADLTYFVLHQLEIVRRAIEELYRYLERKGKELRDVERMLKSGDRFNHRQRAVIAHALRHPDARYTIESHRREHDVVYQTARQDLLDLAEAGILEKRQIGKAFYFHIPPDLERKLNAT